MKKKCALLTVLLLISIGALCGIAPAVNAENDQIVITEEVVYGDKTAAEGLTITSKNHFDRNLLWKSDYTIGVTPSCETEYDFSYQDIQETSDTTSPYITFERSRAYEEQVERMWQRLYDSTAEGETKTISINMKDYFDYYPIEIRFVNSGYGVSFTDEINSVEKEANIEFMKFFRIPVQDSQKITVSISKITDSEYYSPDYLGEHSSGEHYFFDLASTHTNDQFFFTFKQQPAEETGGLPVDTSLIPGGYGIYSFRYNAYQANDDGGLSLITPGTLTNLYSLEEGVRVKHLSLSPDESHLLIFTIEADGSYLRVLDLSTFAETQKIFLGEDSLGSLYTYDDFLVVTLNGTDNHFSVVTRNGNEYKHEFTVPVTAGQLIPYLTNDSELSPEYDKYFFTSYHGLDDMDFDGEKLAIVSKIRDNTYSYNDTCHFNVSVYDKTGLLYHGNYYNSLTPHLWYDYHLNCHPYDIYKTQISWGEDS